MTEEFDISPESLGFRPDKIGHWSEIKLEIVKRYATTYTSIIRTNNLTSVYIDGFSGAGIAVSRDGRQVIKGSPFRALEVRPGYRSLLFH